MSAPASPRPLGEVQRACLQALAGRFEGRPRPYPGGGWIWTNHSQTVKVMESLERRGLADRTGEKTGVADRRRWEINAAGLAAIEATR